MIYTECHEKLHTFVFYFQCQCKCILIKSVHVDYMPPVVYRTLMWRKFDPINVEYFERTSLCKFRKTRQLNLFECLLPIHDRKCLECNVVEDEYHFVLEFNIYTDLRTQYISNYYRCRPNMYKFVDLLNVENPTIIKRLVVYIYI